ncbi:MAG: NYN domain-containing protein [Melioribacteraceae bacterium]|nr:NYN domain-containing protein [Melioribacteraceae bacterium]
MGKKERVIAYIDGFNLYFGIKDKFPQAKWLNIWSLVDNLTKDHQELIAVKYFTSRVAHNPPKEKRQRDYLSVLETTPLEIIYGHYKSRPITCKRCGHSWANNEEKMTDVNIAVQMLSDAMSDSYDTAMLISGDSDLVPPINNIHSNFTDKRVMVVFPPARHNNSVKNAAKGSLIIGRGTLLKSQFPVTVTLPNDYKISKPEEWL